MKASWQEGALLRTCPCRKTCAGNRQTAPAKACPAAAAKKHQERKENPMNAKIRFCALLLAALLLTPLFSLAENVAFEPVAPQAPDIAFEPVLQYMPDITSVSATGYVIVTGKEKLKAVFTTAGEQLSPYRYPNLSYVSFDYFVGFDDAGDNTRALVNVAGETLTEAAYGGFKAFSRKWAVGYVVSPTEKKNSQYTRGKEYFLIDRYDLFYLDGSLTVTQPVASLSPEQYAAAAAHGDYIAIQDGEGQITLHGPDFTAYDLPMEKTTSSIFAVDEYYGIVNLATGETVGEGFVDVKEINTSRGLMFVGTRYDFKGTKISVVADGEGRELAELEYTVSSVSGDYAVVTDKSKNKGLYSLSEGRIIVPCEYKNIMVSKVSTDPYVHNGYVAVEKGDLRGYVDIRTGQLSCEMKYNRKEVTTVGCSTFWKVEDGLYMLAAADGVETEVRVDSIYAKTQGNGYLLIAKKGEFYGLIDWHGQEVLPFIHSKLITLTADSAALIRTSTGTELDRIVIGE